MALVTSTVDPFAALPDPGDLIDVALGAGSTGVAEARFAIREQFRSSTMRQSAFWMAVIEREYGSIRVSTLSDVEVSAAQGGIELGSNVRMVRLPQPDD
jgi:hypothetical protein